MLILKPPPKGRKTNIMKKKRKADQLSSPETETPNEIQKRYQWSYPPLNQNKFYLPKELDPSQVEAPTATTSPKEMETDKEVRIKIPPIYLKESLNYKQVIEDINKIAKQDYTTINTNNSIKINLSDIDDFRTLTKYYSSNKIAYYTYQNPNDKPLSVVIKNTPISLTTDEVTEDLKKSNPTLPILKVTRLTNKDKLPIPICAIELQNNDAAKEIFKISKLDRAIITVEERYKPRGTPQCHRCQKYGHTKNYCNFSPICLKCAGKHYYTECKKDGSTPPTCANCGENHPANFRGCSYFINLTRPTQSRTFSRSPTTQPNNNTTSSIRNGLSYAGATRNGTDGRNNEHRTQFSQQTNPSSQENSFSPILETIFKQILDLLQPIFNQIKEYFIKNLLPNIFTGK